jgi:hypothetical protein
MSLNIHPVMGGDPQIVRWQGKYTVGYEFGKVAGEYLRFVFPVSGHRIKKSAAFH